MFRNRSPFVKGLIGGAIGWIAVMLVVGILYAGLTVYRDHQNLQQIIRYLNSLQQQATPKPAP